MLRLLWTLLVVSSLPVETVIGQDGEELNRILAEERAEADLQRRRGEFRAALRILDEHLEDEPSDAASRTLRALVRADQGRWERAVDEAERALEDARNGADRALGAACARHLAAILAVLGRYEESLACLSAGGDEEPLLVPAEDPRDAWSLGSALLVNGERDAARRLFETGMAWSASGSGDTSWDRLLARGRCEHGLGRLQLASRTFVEADRAARSREGEEPEVLAALADLYFESEREVEAPGKRSAGALYKRALELSPNHERALLGLFELHRYNRRRASRSPESILAQLLGAKPDSVEGLLAGAAADLQDGQLRAVRARLARLRELAPGRRETRTVAASLAWVEHRREACESILAELEREAPFDSRPEREVGRHLFELYRFGEALPFLRRAVERDPTDHEAWTRLGGALANTGDEDGARDALRKAKQAARGRQDAWRNNLLQVLERMEREHVEESFGELSFSWRPDAAEVLRTYFEPFYRQARSELAERYGHTPGPSRIEVFRRLQDFSVRSVGFQGFPALGVCFGPVVTAVSPLSGLRGNFSWARTGFHEFSHVVHLGLSHNRCPRWITEGLATWEEVRRNPTWTRNMRRELIDARANGELIPVRELNRAFRGPRILFGYYQGGLLCEMLIAKHGFPPMIRLLEAFDQGLDLDQSLTRVFGTTPEEIDADFQRFVDARIEGLEIEPRWNRRRVTRLTLRLRGKKPPSESEARREYAEGWATVAWGHWQGGRRIDAEQALRLVDQAGVGLPRAQFLRGEMALAAGEAKVARSMWSAAVEAGGRDYRALVGLGTLMLQAGDGEQAEAMFILAEEVFPGFDSAELSAELKLVELYRARGDEDAAMAARERWLAWNAGAYDMRVEVAAWHAAQDRPREAARLYDEANQVDPFRRDLHLAWGDALRAVGGFDEALREYGVALIVPADLDPDHQRIGPGFLGRDVDPDQLPPGFVAGLPPEAKIPVPLTAAERAELTALVALCLKELGREEESRAARARALDLDPDCERARDLW